MEQEAIVCEIDEEGIISKILLATLGRGLDLRHMDKKPLVNMARVFLTLGARRCSNLFPCERTLTSYHLCLIVADTTGVITTNSAAIELVATPN